MTSLPEVAEDDLPSRTFYYIEVDETQFWNKDFVASLGEGAKFVAKYAFDKEERTRCVDMFPAYWMVYLGTDFRGGSDLTEEQLEDVYENITESESQDFDHYRQCRIVNDYKECPCEASTLDEVRERYQENMW